MAEEERGLTKKVFISYSHQDRITAQGISRYLIRQGYEVWIDVDKLLLGQDWATSIDTALEKSDVFLAIVSRNSIRRAEVLREISDALRRNETDQGFMVLFVVLGNIHSSWFTEHNAQTEKVIDYLNRVQHVQLDAKGTISIGGMQNLLRALNGKLIYNEKVDLRRKTGEYIYEVGMPEKNYDNEAENIFYRINASDLAPSTVFPFALDNQWLPDEIMDPASPYRAQFLKYGFKAQGVQAYIDSYQMKNLYISLMYTRQVILNRASILNSHGIQALYYSDSDCPESEKKAFSELLQDGSIVVFLYGDQEMTPYVSTLPKYDTMKKAIREWNQLCSRIAMYCIRENWETPVDRHREEFVKQCTTLAFNVETNDMLAECFGFDSNQKKEFFTILKEIEMTVFLQTHITGTGNRSRVTGFSRSGFYRNFIVREKSEDCPDPVLDCVFDEEKPFYGQLKKIIDVYYNSIFTNYFNCSALLPNIRPEDTYIHKVYLKHGIKEVGADELEYAFSEFFKNENLLERIRDIGSAFYLSNWNLAQIVQYRNSMRWREYIELLEYITNRSNVWQVDFSEVEKLIDVFVDSVTDMQLDKNERLEAKAFTPAYTFRLCIGSKVLDIITTPQVRKLKDYRGSFSAKNQNNLSIQFILGDTTSQKHRVSDSIFAPIEIFDGRTNHIGGSAYYNEICTFLIEQCNFMWLY